MIDYEVHRCSRRCAATEREFLPGETIMSVLISEGSQVVRRDYGLDAWQGPPEHAVGWWKSQVPHPSAKRLHWAPGEVMLGYFEQLAEEPEKADVRYFLALLMVRRKLLRQESVEKDEAGRETLVLFCPRNELEYRTPVVMPSEDRLAIVQQELSQLLQADGG